MAVPETERDARGPTPSVSHAILESTSLKIAVLGGLLWVVAGALQYEVWPLTIISQSGVWAALLAIWGTALVVVGLVIYGVVWWTHQ